jgi:Outer membrane protein beta-barrel domain
MRRAPLYITLILSLLSAAHTALAQQPIDEKPFEIGAQFTCIRLDQLESIVATPFGTYRTSTFDSSSCGFGGRFGYNLNRYFSIEAEGNFFPDTARYDLRKTRKAQLFTGAKAGIRTEEFGIFAKAKPGIMYFSGFPLHDSCSGFFLGPISCNLEKQTNFALDLGVVAEYYTSDRVILRLDMGDTIIHFKNIGPTPYIGGSVFTPASTTHNLQVSFGVSVRF